MDDAIRVEEVSLTLTPQIAYYPATIHATIKVEPRYDNVMLCIQWEGINGNGPDGKGCWSLDGQYDHRTHFYDIKQLLVGNYDVQATVIRVRGSAQSSRHTIQILESLP